jgi:hypothetical protein
LTIELCSFIYLAFHLWIKHKHSSFSKLLSRIEWKSHNQCSVLASMSVYMTGGKSGTTKLVFTYMWPSCEQKKYQIGANLQLIWAGCHSYCQGACFSTYMQKFNQNQYTICPIPPEQQTKSIPQYPRYFWLCLLNLTKHCPSN